MVRVQHRALPGPAAAGRVSGRIRPERHESRPRGALRAAVSEARR